MGRASGWQLGPQSDQLITSDVVGILQLDRQVFLSYVCNTICQENRCRWAHLANERDSPQERSHTATCKLEVVSRASGTAFGLRRQPINRNSREYP